MEVMRVSMWMPNNEAATVVVRDCDLIVSPEEFRVEMTAPGVLLTYDLFEMEAGATVEQATFAAMDRMEKRVERERHMSTLYYWDAKYLLMAARGGVITSTRVSPLNVEEVSDTLIQLSQHPDYRGQTIMSHTQDDQLVSMKDGKVEVLGRGVVTR